MKLRNYLDTWRLLNPSIHVYELYNFLKTILKHENWSSFKFVVEIFTKECWTLWNVIKLLHCMFKKASFMSIVSLLKVAVYNEVFQHSTLSNLNVKTWFMILHKCKVMKYILVMKFIFTSIWRLIFLHSYKSKTHIFTLMYNAYFTTQAHSDYTFSVQLYNQEIVT